MSRFNLICLSCGGCGGGGTGLPPSRISLSCGGGGGGGGGEEGVDAGGGDCGV